MADEQCAKCNKGFGAGQSILTAQEKKFHPECFVCAECNNSLSGVQFFVKEDDRYCQNCFKEKFQPKCKKCDVSIDPTEKYVIFEDSKFHQACFLCVSCGKSLADEKFVKKDDGFYCQEHA